MWVIKIAAIEVDIEGSEVMTSFIVGVQSGSRILVEFVMSDHRHDCKKGAMSAPWV